jgi:hypothetical protein
MTRACQDEMLFEKQTAFCWVVPAFALRWQEHCAYNKHGKQRVEYGPNTKQKTYADGYPSDAASIVPHASGVNPCKAVTMRSISSSSSSG